MPQVLKGAAVAKAIREGCKEKTQTFVERGILPTLCIMRVGEKSDDIFYEESAMKKCAAVGIRVIHKVIPETADTTEMLNEIWKVNEDDGIHGLLLLRPLPKHMDEKGIIAALKREKDVDCMVDENLYAVLCGDERGFVPCTPQAVVRLMEHYGIQPEGKEAVVIGRSTVVGKPLGMMLSKRNATVTYCHTMTKDIRAVCKRADVLICAAGKAKMVDASFVKEGAVVIDVGINTDENGKMVGDADTDDVLKKASAVTPVPGGIGSITSWLLIEHVLKACEAQTK